MHICVEQNLLQNTLIRNTNVLHLVTKPTGPVRLLFGTSEAQETELGWFSHVVKVLVHK